MVVETLSSSFFGELFFCFLGRRVYQFGCCRLLELRDSLLGCQDSLVRFRQAGPWLSVFDGVPQDKPSTPQSEPNKTEYLKEWLEIDDDVPVALELSEWLLLLSVGDRLHANSWR